MTKEKYHALLAKLNKEEHAYVLNIVLELKVSRLKLADMQHQLDASNEWLNE